MFGLCILSYWNGHLKVIQHKKILDVQYCRGGLIFSGEKYLKEDFLLPTAWFMAVLTL
jgi:hypothetical protein